LTSRFQELESISGRITDKKSVTSAKEKNEEHDRWETEVEDMDDDSSSDEDDTGDKFHDDRGQMLSQIQVKLASIQCIHP